MTSKMEDIRQFQTKEERANEELRRLLTQGVVKHVTPQMGGKDWFLATLTPRRKFMNSDFHSVADWDKGLY